MSQTRLPVIQVAPEKREDLDEILRGIYQKLKSKFKVFGTFQDVLVKSKDYHSNDLKARARAGAMTDVFPEDLQALLNFKWKDKWLIVKPKESLNSQNFAKILTVIKQLNGIYKIRMPLKRSYFEIPLT